MAGGRRGAPARAGRLRRQSASALLVLVALTLALAACSNPQPSLEAGVPLGRDEALGDGRYRVDEEVTYEADLECRIVLPANSETLELGGVETGPIELEAAPSPLYVLGVETEVTAGLVRSRDHTTWLELATLEPVPGLGGYESTRDADRETAVEALRKVRGPEVTEMDLVQAKIREFYLSATVTFRIPADIRTQTLDMERQVGGVLVAFFIAPELPGEGVSLTLAAPTESTHYEVEVTEDDVCARLVMRREDFFGGGGP